MKANSILSIKALLAISFLGIIVSCTTVCPTKFKRLNAVNDFLFEIVKQDKYFHTTIIGEVTYRKKEYPIILFQYLPANKIRYMVLNTGGIHGNEPGGVESILRLIEQCRKNRPDVIAMDFVVCINPWGYENNRRSNSNHIDLNRDFKELRSQEARIITNYFQGKKYDLVVDHHENQYANGYSIICHDEANRSIITSIIRTRKLNMYEIATRMQKVDNYADGITVIDLGNGKGFSQYAGLNLCNPKRTFVIETPTKWSIDKRIQCHLDIEKELEERFIGIKE